MKAEAAVPPIVLAKIRSVFPGHPEEKILAALQRYGSRASEPEATRVHLAVLKICEEQGLSGPGQTIHLAKQDYRDVLSMAEYPNAARATIAQRTDPEAMRALREADLDQYRRWLASP